jgi:hypothetical protein
VPAPARLFLDVNLTTFDLARSFSGRQAAKDVFDLGFDRIGPQETIGHPESALFYLYFLDNKYAVAAQHCQCRNFPVPCTIGRRPATPVSIHSTLVD